MSFASASGLRSCTLGARGALARSGPGRIVHRQPTGFSRANNKGLRGLRIGLSLIHISEPTRLALI
eukprot:3611212-Alexandrium_andersonii.AAC.1